VLVRAGMYDPDILFPWSVTAAFLLFFALLNSLMSLKHENFGKYWGKSMYSYMALALVLGVCAWGVTGKTVGEAGSYKWIIFVVTFGFLVFLSMVNFMKRIVRFAEREEWNQPRRRR
jgi:ABC-type transport system involved in multi-copper enzyme maturation permease subunit